jgi:hypothetical protein
MNLSENHFNNMHVLYQDTKETFMKLNKLQSALDRKVSEIYHIVEKSDFNMAEGNEFARQLKETLQYRRVVKDELARLAPVYNMLREQVAIVDEQYDRACRKSYEIRQRLNVSMGLEQVFEVYSVD